MNNDLASNGHTERREKFLESLVSFSKDHRAARWSGSFAQFLESILPAAPAAVARTSHEYIWDMIRSEGYDGEDGKFRCKLFEDELFGIDETLERLIDYFKAASAGSEVGRRLLLLLRQASGRKFPIVILLKPGLWEDRL